MSNAVIDREKGHEVLRVKQFFELREWCRDSSLNHKTSNTERSRTSNNITFMKFAYSGAFILFRHASCVDFSSASFRILPHAAYVRPT